MSADPATPASERASTLSLDRAVAALRGSWPALDERRLGGWLLGFSEGFTRRANSVWMLGAVKDLPAAVGAVEEAYRVRGLPSRFLTTDLSDSDEVAALRAFGYVTSLSGEVFACSLGPADGPRQPLTGSHPSAVVSASAPQLPPDWLDAWLTWNGRRLPSDRRLAPRILSQGTPSFLSVSVDGSLVATARLTVVDGLGIVDCLVTDRASRGRGYARQLLKRAEHEAFALGASSCLAMVVDGNDASIRLFDRLGYHRLGAFRYLEGPARTSCC
ncbi:ribosomal protein S18 acetylase RimI-like enzyme [Pseudoclavibacter sp. JAI123]|uniref:GNAT family N-acetyltransferase n=1 Tax=Pseudoclavibacter sp. JAI123 TaxID=2723065 RepID=UPI0015C80B3F|nr:GNAT family N-acetyltransferase [Pseudoclavibacter sp. JAI123]NYF13651.1 ribosomal protein S18 acetylase RimI-like enzyme [Pseudoclavibacter sp. JAI123]